MVEYIKMSNCRQYDRGKKDRECLEGGVGGRKLYRRQVDKAELANKGNIEADSSFIQFS